MLRRTSAPSPPRTASASRCRWLCGQPRKLQGKQAWRSLTACLGHHPPATLQTGKAGWSRHQPASKVAVPADIHGGDAVAENYPSELSDALAVRNMALPFLSAGRVKKSSQALGHLANLLDRPADRFRGPIQVQDQAVPETVGRLQPVRPQGDHPCLVVDSLHRRTRLMRIKVVQDLGLPPVVGRKEGTEIQSKAFGLTAELPQPTRRCGAVARRVKDLFEPETDPVQLLQVRDLLEQVLQRLLLLGRQALWITAERPHLRTKRLPLGLGQLRLVLTGQFFRSASTASLNFLATW